MEKRKNKDINSYKSKKGEDDFLGLLDNFMDKLDEKEIKKVEQPLENKTRIGPIPEEKKLVEKIKKDKLAPVLDVKIKKPKMEKEHLKKKITKLPKEIAEEREDKKLKKNFFNKKIKEIITKKNKLEKKKEGNIGLKKVLKEKIGLAKKTDQIKTIEEKPKKQYFFTKLKTIKAKFNFKKISEKDVGKKTTVKENIEQKKIKFPKFGLKWRNAGTKKIEDKKAENKKIILPKLKSSYETDFDRLYDVVEKENVVNLSKVTEAFNVDKAIVQRWGEMLNEHELIEYHVPAFGEPEFRKKGLVVEQKNKVSKNKKIAIGLSAVGVFLLILVGFFFISGLLQNTGDRINVIRPMPPSEQIINAVNEDVKGAFSGNGSYVCRSGSVKYYIKDKLLRAEDIDKKSTIIVKSGFMYIYNSDNDKWTKAEVRKDIVLPGSGKTPENVNCKKEEVSITLFDVPEGKVI